MKVLVFLALATVVLSQNWRNKEKLFGFGKRSDEYDDGDYVKRSEIEEEIVKRCGSGQVALQKRSTDELVEILKRCGDGLVIEKREEEEEVQVVNVEARGSGAGGKRFFFRSLDGKKKLAELEERKTKENDSLLQRILDEDEWME